MFLVTTPCSNANARYAPRSLINLADNFGLVKHEHGGIESHSLLQLEQTRLRMKVSIDENWGE
jgi:hypothetical protein